jgi:uncharacterized lipoprotein
MLLINYKLITRYGLLIMIILLAACNLQQSEPTATISATQQSESTPQPTIQQPAQPTLRPTPTSLPLASLSAVTPPPGAVTTIPLGGTANNLTPTLNPTDADQRHELQVRDGDTIGVNYAVTLITGTVSFTLQGPDGVVWQKTLTISETSRAEVTVTQGGKYEILVQLDRFDGNYNVSWD